LLANLYGFGCGHLSYLPPFPHLNFIDLAGADLDIETLSVVDLGALPSCLPQYQP
jgi:hypothetical protein